MSAATDVPRGRYGFERRGWWAAATVLLAMLAVWFIPAFVNDAVAEPSAKPVDTSETYTLTDEEGDPVATVTPIAGWTTRTGTSGPQLSFESGAASVAAAVFTNVRDIDRFWDRQARAAAANSPPQRMVRHGSHTTSAGLSGPTGTVTGTDTHGEVYLLADSAVSGTVLMLSIAAPPGSLSKHADEFGRFLDSAEMTS